jgi:hypothetical protein
VEYLKFCFEEIRRFGLLWVTLASAAQLEQLPFDQLSVKVFPEHVRQEHE